MKPTDEALKKIYLSQKPFRAHWNEDEGGGYSEYLWADGGLYYSHNGGEVLFEKNIELIETEADDFVSRMKPEMRLVSIKIIKHKDSFIENYLSKKELETV